MNFAMEENKIVRSSNKPFNFKVNREKKWQQKKWKKTRGWQMKPHTKGKTWFCNDERGSVFSLYANLTIVTSDDKSQKLDGKTIPFSSWLFNFNDFFTIFFYFCMCIFSLMAIVDHICASFTKKKRKEKKNACLHVQL